MKWIAAALVFACGVLLFKSGMIVDRGEPARTVAAKMQINRFLEALRAYHADTGEFPTDEQGLRALQVDPGVHGWRGPYLPRPRVKASFDTPLAPSIP